MVRKLSIAFALGSLLAGAACTPQAPTSDDTATSPAAAPAPGSTASVDPVQTPNTVGPAPGDAVNDGSPDLTPARLTPEAERTAKGATNILISWARAIELREWDQAWALLSPADREKWTKTQWAALFADLKDVTVAFDGGQMEGAAGSSYYTAPIRIEGTDAQGRPVRYEGEATLRRVNDVDGASPAQLRWNFASLTLDWTH